MIPIIYSWAAEGGCRDGLAIIDDAGVVRVVMTSGLEQEDAAAHLVTTVAELKKNKEPVKAENVTLLGPKSKIIDHFNDKKLDFDPY